MSPGAREVAVFATTLVAAGACARYYVLAVLDGDRPLSRAAAPAAASFRGGSGRPDAGRSPALYG